ncbi:MAG: SnoaL-like domain-containing protein [Chthoniobacterales bacterium]
MDTKQVGEKVVELVRKQAWHEAIDTLYGDEVVSVEAQGREGESPEKRGIDAVRAKADWWVASMEVYEFKATGPFVAHDRFVVLYDVDFSEKGKPDRIQMSEAGVYTVKEGKIVREEFLPLAEEKG